MRYFLMNFEYMWEEVEKAAYLDPMSFNVTCVTCGELLSYFVEDARFSVVPPVALQIVPSVAMEDGYYHKSGRSDHTPVPKTHWINNKACTDSEGLVTISIANVGLQKFSELIDLLQSSWR